MENEEMPFTGKHLESVTQFIDKARKGEAMPLPNKVAGKEAIVVVGGEFIGLSDKMIIVGDLISLKAECEILEAVAKAADKVENPPKELLFALNRLYRRGQVT